MAIRFRIPALSLGLIAVFTPIAAQAEWTGSGELGLVFARGNSDTETVNAGFELAYAQDRWTNTLKASYLRSENDGELDASRFLISNNTLYDLSERSYLVGSARYDQDKFSSFEYQATAGLGYGYRVLDGETHTLSAEIGPGVRFSEIRDTGESETKLIARGAVDYAWQISETAKLENALLVESGASNTFVENSLSLEVAINTAMSLKTGVAVRHNTDVQPGRDNTDVLSTVNLVYSFD